MANQLTCELPPNRTLTLTTNNAGQVDFKVGTGTGGSEVVVNHTYFVDASHTSDSVHTGSLTFPFLTLQAAINAAVASGLSTVTIFVAPGTYIENPVIPINITLGKLIFTGWANYTTIDATPETNLGGNITNNAPTVTMLSFVNLFLGGTTIQPTNPATDLLMLRFDHCQVTAAINAGEVDIAATSTKFFGNITGAVTTAIGFDGYTWAQIINTAAVILPATYTRQFYDTGSDVNLVNATVQGVAIGTWGDVSINFPGAREGELAIAGLQTDNTSSDFVLVFVCTQNDTVRFKLFNISRLSHDFDEPIICEVFHSNMAVV
jgi:hypothetical protein